MQHPKPLRSTDAQNQPKPNVHYIRGGGRPIATGKDQTAAVQRDRRAQPNATPEAPVEGPTPREKTGPPLYNATAESPPRSQASEQRQLTKPRRGGGERPTTALKGPSKGLRAKYTNRIEHPELRHAPSAWADFTTDIPAGVPAPGSQHPATSSFPVTRGARSRGIHQRRASPIQTDQQPWSGGASFFQTNQLALVR